MPVGSVLVYVKDDSVTAMVVEAKKVRAMGRVRGLGRRVTTGRAALVVSLVLWLASCASGTDASTGEAIQATAVAVAVDATVTAMQLDDPDPPTAPAAGEADIESDADATAELLAEAAGLASPQEPASGFYRGLVFATDGFGGLTIGDRVSVAQLVGVLGAPANSYTRPASGAVAELTVHDWGDGLSVTIADGRFSHWRLVPRPGQALDLPVAVESLGQMDLPSQLPLEEVPLGGRVFDPSPNTDGPHGVLCSTDPGVCVLGGGHGVAGIEASGPIELAPARINIDGVNYRWVPTLADKDPSYGFPTVVGKLNEGDRVEVLEVPARPGPDGKRWAKILLPGDIAAYYVSAEFLE